MLTFADTTALEGTISLDDQRAAWHAKEVERLRKLGGRNITGWIGREMAVREESADGHPAWRDSSVSYLQMRRLDAHFSDGSCLSFVTEEFGGLWSLATREGLPPLELEPDEPGSIYRTRSFPTLPVGSVARSSIVLEGDEIAGSLLDIGGCEVSLCSGEIYEQTDGSLKVVMLDESVLVQVDGQHPDALPRRS